MVKLRWSVTDLSVSIPTRVKPVKLRWSLEYVSVSKNNTPEISLDSCIAESSTSNVFRYTANLKSAFKPNPKSQHCTHLFLITELRSLWNDGLIVWLGYHFSRLRRTRSNFLSHLARGLPGHKALKSLRKKKLKKNPTYHILALQDMPPRPTRRRPGWVEIPA